MKVIARSIVGLVGRVLERERLVPIDRCYHFRGFRYGGFGNNPYEDYIVGLANGAGNIGELRSSFADSIVRYRPKTMAEALQIEVKEVPAWNYPWMRKRNYEVVTEPAQNPDIICHYCDRGILVSHINREFRWLERSLAGMQGGGYKPDRHGYVVCMEFVGKDTSSYLVLDGNHRISALHAVGVRELVVRLRTPSRVRRSGANRWPGVLDGTYTATDALRVFDRYFWQLNPPITNLRPARLIRDETPLWCPIKTAEVE